MYPSFVFKLREGNYNNLRGLCIFETCKVQNTDVLQFWELNYRIRNALKQCSSLLSFKKWLKFKIKTTM